MSSPRVSVVVPNYNHGRFLEQRLRSILDQTFTDFELIYLDDASTDDSSAVFSRFASEPRIRAVVSETNSGSPFVQWNRGVAAASGELIWIAEADDHAAPGFLARMVATLDANPEVGIAYCQSISVDEFDQPLHSREKRKKKSQRKSDRTKHDYVKDGREELREEMVLGCTIPNASAAVFRKQVFDKAGGAAVDFPTSGDWMTWINMLMQADVAYVADPLNSFRRHGGSVRAHSKREGKQSLDAYEIVQRVKEEVGLSPHELERACDHHLRKWLKRAIRRRNRIPFRTNLEILRAAREVDAHLARRVVRQVLRV